MPNKPSYEQLVADIQDLQIRLEHTEATLSEILSGEADALFVTGATGAQLFTLKGADQSYRLLIENMSEGALTISAEGVILYANRRVAGMLKTPLEKLIGSEIFNWVAAESRQALQALLLKNERDNHREELALTAADGTLVPAYLSVSRLVLDEIDTVCMVVTDLTEQKRYDAILAAEKLARAILEQSADAIVICDESGRIMRTSKKAQAFCSKRLHGQLFEQAFPLRQRDGTTLPAVGAIDTNFREARLECNGQIFDLLVSVGHLKGARDELLGSVVTLTDITERKKAELAILEELTFTEQLIQSLPDTFFLVDHDGSLLRWNNRLEELFGLTPEQMLRANALAFAHDEDRLQAAGTLQRAFDTGSASVEVRMNLTNGLRDYLLTGNRIETKLGVNVIGIGHDITERKQAVKDLNLRTAFFEALVKTSADGILVVDSQGKKILQNRTLIELWKIPEDIAANTNDNLQLQFIINRVVDARQFGDKVHYLYEHPEETSQDEVVLNDGTILDRYSAPVLDGDGHSYGRIWSFRDITERKQNELKLLESERRFTDLLGNVDLVSVMLDREARITYCNDFLLHLTGWKREEVVGKNWWDIFMPSELHHLKDDFFAALLDNQPVALHHENDIVTRSGERRLVRWNNSLLRSGTGEVIGTASIGEDITERKKAEASVVHLNRVLLVLSSINTLIVRVNDRDELFREACNIAVEAGGFRMAMIVTVDQSTMLPVSVTSAGKNEKLQAEIKNVLSSGASMQKTLVGQVIRENKTVISNDTQNDSGLLFGKHYVEAGVKSMMILPLIVSHEAIGAFALYASEIDFFHDEEMKLLTELAGDIAFAIDHIGKQEKLNYLAYYDVLTGLANRTLFLERVAQHMRSAERGGHKLALGMLDLERFKSINDSLGRPVGDALLKQVAEWLTFKMGDASLLARIDTDHFAVVLPQVKSDGNLAQLVENLMAAFMEHPFHLNDAMFRIGIKVGIALFPDDGDNADSLFRNAEAALKNAKTSGDKFLFYTQKMTTAVAAKLTLENQLRQAIDNEEFVLHYQPKVNLVSGKVTSAEALIRWNDPRTGLVPPGKFIPVLEETGLIAEVGRWALRKAIDDSLRWRAAGLAAVRIAVNVSPLQLRNINFIDEVRQAITVDAHAAATLELEITESVIMNNIEFNISTLQTIRAMGITIAIDDFGTGFSSLSYLAKLPVDTLKIDRSFVLEMTAGPEGLALVSTIINLAHSLRLKVVAEGVDTDEQSHLLQLLNCDEIQGFLFSKPVPADIFETEFLTPLTLEKKE